MNAHVDDAVIKYTAISSKTLKDPASLSDEILINDTGVLKKITLQQISSFVTNPPGMIVDYAGDTAPTGWLLCYGQAISRITYSALFTALGNGTIYGAGDGSSTFNLPDCRGRVLAGKDNMGGSSADRLTDFGTLGVNGDTLGDTGGLEKHTLSVPELAAHQHNYQTFSGTITAASGPFGVLSGGAVAGTEATGSNVAHNNVQPTIIFNKIIKT